MQHWPPDSVCEIKLAGDCHRRKYIVGIDGGRYDVSKLVSDARQS